MLTFKQFLEEDTLPFASTQREVKANLDDPTTIDELNRYLAQVAAVGCVNPYGGLQNVSKVLSTYGITLPRVNYLPEPIGEQVFEVEQWGAHPGYNNYYNSTIDGIRTNSGIPIPYQAADDAARKSGEKLYVYYTWKMNENGLYDTFCMLVDKEGISTIMGESFLEDLEPVNEGKKGWSGANKAAQARLTSNAKMAASVNKAKKMVKLAKKK